MAKYYTLDEAAQALQTSTEEVRQLAEDKTVRAFRDRGTLRFRAEEIDELARQRGLGSDPSLQFEDLPEPKKGNTPAPSKKEKPEDSGVLPFDLGIDDEDEENVDIGLEKIGGGSSASPKPGSDSDVRLVSDGSDLDLEMEASSDDVPAVPDSGPIGKDSSKKSGDSGVRIVPLDDASDSDVKMVTEDEDEVTLGEGKKTRGASDSDIRIENV